ncbi:MAG: hypothetical protein ACJAYU_002373 [Bradymonadia bacterium]|jgi:hypothetical protein
MGTEKLVIPHELNPTRARQATEKALESYGERFSDYLPTADWVRDNRCEISFTVRGKTLDGAMELHPGEVHLELDVPFLLRPFKNRALGVIKDQIEIWIARAATGELDVAEE